MTSEVAKRVAEVILEDRRAERIYDDPERLSHYLLGSCAPGSCLYQDKRDYALMQPPR